MTDERRGWPAEADPPHLDDDTLERFAAEELDAHERARARAHADACPSCAALLQGVTLLRAGARQFDPGAPRRKPALNPRRWVPAAIAAMIAIAALLPMITTRLSAPSEPPSTTRNGAIEAPLPISPTGQVTDAPARFEWRPLNGARWYVLLLFREDGSVMWEGRVKGASADRPPDLQLPPGRYYWRVRAFTDENTTAESSLTAFEIKHP